MRGILRNSIHQLAGTAFMLFSILASSATLAPRQASALEPTFHPPSTAGAWAGCDIRIEPVSPSINGSVDGRILDEGGHPLEGVRVTARKPGEGEAVYVTESEESGRYRFSEVNPGLYVLEGEKPGFETSQRVVIVAYEGRSTMDFILRREAPRSP